MDRLTVGDIPLQGIHLPSSKVVGWETELVIVWGAWNERKTEMGGFQIFFFPQAAVELGE